MKSQTTIILDSQDYEQIASIVAKEFNKVKVHSGDGFRVKKEFDLFKLNFYLEADYEFTKGNDFATEDTPIWNEVEIDYVDVLDFHAFDMEGNELELDYNVEELNAAIKTHSS